MILFPNAKINLGLNITERRPDGYHNLESIFLPVSLCDMLEVVPSPDGNTTLHQSGLVPEGAEQEKNLVVRAYRILEKEYQIPPIHIYLHKQIPSGAGMGGGSSDAAYMLKLLNTRFHLDIPQEQLQQKALSLGADCPFFIQNAPSFVSGIGETLRPIDFCLNTYRIAIVKPPLFVSTAEAFRLIRPHRSTIPVLQAVLEHPIEEWKDILHNDFEDSLFPLHPQLTSIKEKLYASGALYASMTGSGSAFFALYPLAGQTEPSPTAQQLQELFPESFTWIDDCRS